MLFDDVFYLHRPAVQRISLILTGNQRSHGPLSHPHGHWGALGDFLAVLCPRRSHFPGDTDAAGWLPAQ